MQFYFLKRSHFSSHKFLFSRLSEFNIIYHLQLNCHRMSDADHNIRNRERTSSGAANGSSSLRERKDKKGAGDANYAKGPSTMKRGSTSKRGLYFLVLCLVGFATWTVIFSNTNSASHSVTWWDENVHLRFGFQKLTYAVIIDAGSTGTRVLGFEFHQSLKGNFFIEGYTTTMG